MEPSERAELIYPSEWVLLIFAAVLLGAAVSDQSKSDRIPAQVEATQPVEAPVSLGDTVSLAEKASVADTARAITSNAINPSATVIGSTTSDTVIPVAGNTASLIPVVATSTRNPDDTKIAAVTVVQTGIASDVKKTSIDATN